MSDPVANLTAIKSHANIAVFPFHPFFYLTLQFGAMFHGQHNGLRKLDVQLFDSGHDTGVGAYVTSDQVVDRIHYIRPRTVKHFGILRRAAPKKVTKAIFMTS